jgi:ribosomal protein L37AE/L43A
MLLNHHSDVEKMEEVDLIASGYDWDCPNCEHMNHIIETKDVVECDECHHIYKTGEVHHAYA